jgi:hypothetical protein
MFLNHGGMFSEYPAMFPHSAGTFRLPEGMFSQLTGAFLNSPETIPDLSLSFRERAGICRNDFKISRKSLFINLCLKSFFCCETILKSLRGKIIVINTRKSS